MGLSAGLRNLLGLTLLLVSLALAAACAWLPPLATFSSQAGWLLVPGVLAYLASALVYLPPGPPRHPAMQTVLAIRRNMASRLSDLRSSDTVGAPVLVSVVSDAIRDLDTGLLPTFRQIVINERSLTKHLQEYEQGRLVPPDPKIMARLQAILARLREAIEVCVRQAANAYAILLELSVLANERAVVDQAEMWATDLQDISDGLAEVLRGTETVDPVVRVLRGASGESATVLPVLDAAIARVEAERREVDAAPPLPGASARRANPGNLTDREVEVLRLLALGKRAKEIADELVVSIATVQRHTQNIYNKINARGRADATRWALAHDIISIGEKGLKYA